MPKYRSATTTHGRNMAGARALWRATGMTDADFGKPIIAVVNSFTQFVRATCTCAISVSWLPSKSKPPAAWRKSSTPLRWMTVSQWATGNALFTAVARADRRLGGVHG